MKLRVRRIDLIQAVHFYQEELSRKFLGEVMSPAMKERMQFFLQEMQHKKQRTETTNVWKVPLTVVFLDNGNFYLDIVNPSDILIMD